MHYGALNCIMDSGRCQYNFFMFYELHEK